jgi:hypothetical protein
MMLRVLLCAGLWLGLTAIVCTINSGAAFSQENYTISELSNEPAIFPTGSYKRFTVKVTDAAGRPVAGLKLAWTQPADTNVTIITETDPSGISSSENPLTHGLPGAWTLFVNVLKDQTMRQMGPVRQGPGNSWGSDAPEIPPLALGERITLNFTQFNWILEPMPGNPTYIDLGAYKTFTVRIRDADSGNPVKGVKLAWTQKDTNVTYIGETNVEGISTSTNVFTHGEPGIYTLGVHVPNNQSLETGIVRQGPGNSWGSTAPVIPTLVFIGEPGLQLQFQQGQLAQQPSPPQPRPAQPQHPQPPPV